MNPGRKAIEVLRDRKGFDWWWSDIAAEDRRDIIRELNEALQPAPRKERA